MALLLSFVFYILAYLFILLVYKSKSLPYEFVLKYDAEHGVVPFFPGLFLAVAGFFYNLFTLEFLLFHILGLNFSLDMIPIILLASAFPFIGLWFTNRAYYLVFGKHYLGRGDYFLGQAIPLILLPLVALALAFEKEKSGALGGLIQKNEFLRDKFFDGVFLLTVFFIFRIIWMSEV